MKIAAAGVNFIDVYFREGRYPIIRHYLGQEAAGVVSEVGSDVKDFKPGDRVAYTGITGAYAEYQPCLRIALSVFRQALPTIRPLRRCCKA